MIGVKFGEYHSYNDLNLILNSKEIGSPEIKENMIDIQGADGFLDYTDFFGGEPLYKNRQLVFNFTINAMVIGDYFLAYSYVQDLIHGKKREIYLDDDSLWYYVGRIEVGKLKIEKGIASFQIVCDCEPYKYYKYETTVSGTVSGSLTLQLFNQRKRVIPVINTSAAMTLEFEGVAYDLVSGRNDIPEIELKAGTNIVSAIGNGTISFTYREARL